MKKILLILLIMCTCLKMSAVVYHNETHKVTHFDYSEYTVTYTDADGIEQTVPITEKATTPEHMMALLRLVYRDETIPGIHYAYDYNGTQYRKIDYNTYGHLGDNSTGNWVGAKTDVYPNPLEDGMTLLIVQVKENWGVSYHNKYSNMRDYFANAYSSIQLVPKFTRVNNEQNPGYIFSIDGATNRFFFISKGKPRSTYTKPLFRLFEQISPVNPHAGDAATISFIDSIKAGRSYYCYHDCTNVTSMTGGHWFTISKTGENYNLNNLSIFIPDRRFEYQLIDNTDNYVNSSYFNEYGNSQNPGEEDWTVMPQVFMYTVDLGGSVEAVEDDEHEDGNYFKIKLNWEGSYTRINAPQHYYVYQIDENGNRTLLTTIDNHPTMATSHEYVVERQVEPQTFHYIVTGAPINYDEDGSMLLDSVGNPLITISADSKVCTLTVPGKDPYFTSSLQYRSRYDINNEVNIYKNKIGVKPNTADDYAAIKNAPVNFTLTRTDDQNNTVAIANIEFSYNTETETYNYAVTYNQSTQNTTLTFDDEQPSLSGSFHGYSDAVVTIIDRFTASTADNEQSSSYVYNFSHNDNAVSNTCVVPVYKTTNNVKGDAYTKAQVIEDTDHSLDCTQSTSVTFEAMNRPIAHIMQYDVYRVNEQQTVTRIGKAENVNNLGYYCVLGLNSNGIINNIQSWQQVSENGGELTITDNFSPISQTLSFVPVITAQLNDDTNTYGCNFQQIAYPSVKVKVNELIKSSPFAGAHGPLMGYLATLEIEPNLTENIDNVFYYRVWRVMEEGTTTIEEETLLNSKDEAEGAEYGMSYSQIQSTYPGVDNVVITDLFVDDVLRMGDSKKVTYIVRMYSTPIESSENETPDRQSIAAVNDGYFIAEERIDVYYNDNVVTAITDINNENKIIDTIYYNVLGIPSNKPYKGINIVTYKLNNGMTLSQKIIIR